MTLITKQTAIQVIEFVKSKGLEVRFSSEDSFRSDLVDLLSVYSAVDKVGVNRVGIADTVGCASPRQVFDLVRSKSKIMFPSPADTSFILPYNLNLFGHGEVDSEFPTRHGLTPLVSRDMKTNP